MSQSSTTSKSDLEAARNKILRLFEGIQEVGKRNSVNTPFVTVEEASDAVSWIERIGVPKLEKQLPSYRKRFTKVEADLAHTMNKIRAEQALIVKIEKIRASPRTQGFLPEIENISVLEKKLGDVIKSISELMPGVRSNVDTDVKWTPTDEQREQLANVIDGDHDDYSGDVLFQCIQMFIQEKNRFTEEISALQERSTAQETTVQNLNATVETLEHQHRKTADRIKELSSTVAKRDEAIKSKGHDYENLKRNTQDKLNHERKCRAEAEAKLKTATDVNAKLKSTVDADKGPYEKTLADLLEMKEQSTRERQTIAKLTDDLNQLKSEFASSRTYWSTETQHLKDDREQDRLLLEGTIANMERNSSLDRKAITSLQTAKDKEADAAAKEISTLKERLRSTSDDLQTSASQLQQERVSIAHDRAEWDRKQKESAGTISTLHATVDRLQIESVSLKEQVQSVDKMKKENADLRVAYPKALLETVRIIVADASGSYDSVKLSELSALLTSMGLDYKDYVGPSRRWPVRPFAQDFFPKKPYNKSFNLSGGVTLARMIHLALRGARQSEAIFLNLVQVQLHVLNNGTFLGSMQQYAPFMFEFLTQCVRQSLVFDMGLEACLALSMLAQYFGESPSTEAFARKLVKTIQAHIAPGEKSIIKTCMLRLLAVIINIHPACRDLRPELIDQGVIHGITNRIQFGELPVIINDLFTKEQEIARDRSVNLCYSVPSRYPGFKLFVYRYSLPRKEKPMQFIFVNKHDGTRKLFFGEPDLDYEIEDGHMGVKVTLPKTRALEDVFRVTPSTSFWTFLSEWKRDEMERVMDEYRTARREQNLLADAEREELERNERRERRR